MKRIWNEHIIVAKYVDAWVYEEGYADPIVIRDRHTLVVRVQGWFDRETKTLRVELAALTSQEGDLYFGEPVTRLLTLEHATREHATRCVIEMADQYVLSVKLRYEESPLDQSQMSDADVLAAHEAAMRAEAL